MRVFAIARVALRGRPPRASVRYEHKCMCTPALGYESTRVHDCARVFTNDYRLCRGHIACKRMCACARVYLCALRYECACSRLRAWPPPTSVRTLRTQVPTKPPTSRPSLSSILPRSQEPEHHRARVPRAGIQASYLGGSGKSLHWRLNLRTSTKHCWWAPDTSAETQHSLAQMAGVALAQISAYRTHKNLAVRKIMEMMRTAYAKSGMQSQHVSNNT